MNIRSQVFVFLLVFAVALLMAAPAFAQDISTPEPAPVVIVTDPNVETPMVVEAATDNVPGEADARDLATSIEDAFLNSAIGTSQLVALIVALIKFLPPLRNVPAKTLNLVTTLMVTALIIGAAYVGRSAELTTIFTSFQQFAPIVVSLVTTFIGAAATFKLASFVNAPVIGSSRT